MLVYVMLMDDSALINALLHFAWDNILSLKKTKPSHHYFFVDWCGLVIFFIYCTVFLPSFLTYLTSDLRMLPFSFWSFIYCLTTNEHNVPVLYNKHTNSIIYYDKLFWGGGMDHKWRIPVVVRNFLKLDH